MFDASKDVDTGQIYMQKELTLSGFELNDEIREKQGNLTITMCKDFVSNFTNYSSSFAQVGKETYYRKRTSKDSELDINKTITEQFNLFRIVDNKNYPAFFVIEGKKYYLHIYRDKK